MGGDGHGRAGRGGGSRISWVALLLALGAGVHAQGAPARAPVGAYAGQSVSGIDVSGPEKTLPGTVEAYAGLAVGDVLSPGELERVERRLLATGLFSEVRVGTQPEGGGRVRVRLEVEDKTSWVVAPTFVLSSSNVGGGALYAENNLWGRSKKFIVAGQVSSADTGLYLGYLDPDPFGWPALRLSLEGQARSDRVEEYALGAEQRAPAVLRTTRLTSGGGAGELGILWFESFRTAAKYRLTLLEVGSPRGEAGSGVAQESGGRRLDATLRFMAGIDTRQNLHAVMEGLNLEASYEVSSPGVGSDYSYRRLGLLYRHGLRFFREHNLVLRGEAALGEDLPFHAELTSGGTALRGFLHRQFRGDTRLTFNAEYHVPLFTLTSLGLSFRGLAFSDSGLVLTRRVPEGGVRLDASGRVVRGYLPGARSALDGAQLAQGVGGGLRLYLRNIVLPLLGVDVAYGVNSGEVRYYLVAGVTPS